LDAAIVSVHIQVERIDVAVFKVANNNVAAKVALAIAAVPHKLAVIKTCTFMPCLGSYIVNPCGIAAWKCQHIKSMAFLLVGVRNSVRDVAVLSNGVFHSMSRNTDAGIAVGEAYQGAANARASGYVGGANALTGGLGQYLNYTGNQNMTNALRALPYGPNYGQYTPGSNTFVGPLPQ